MQSLKGCSLVFVIIFKHSDKSHEGVMAIRPHSAHIIYYL